MMLVHLHKAEGSPEAMLPYLVVDARMRWLELYEHKCCVSSIIAPIRARDFI